MMCLTPLMIQDAVKHYQKIRGEKMGKVVECNVWKGKKDNLDGLIKAIKKFANDELKCEIDGKKVGSINKLIIDYEYGWNGPGKDFKLKAEVSVY